MPPSVPISRTSASGHTVVSTASALEEYSMTEILSPSEFGVYERRMPQRREEWLLGRYVAKRAAVEYVLATYGVTCPLSSFSVVSEGPPYFRAESEDGTPLESLHVSIAHSGNRAIAHVAPKSVTAGVGVDIEEVRHFSPTTLEAFLTAHEYASYEALSAPERDVYATELWCIKEAYSKAHKVGLLMHPRRIEVVRHDTALWELVVDGVPVSLSMRWTTHCDGYIMVTLVL